MADRLLCLSAITQCQVRDVSLFQADLQTTVSTLQLEDSSWTMSRCTLGLVAKNPDGKDVHYHQMVVSVCVTADVLPSDDDICECNSRCSAIRW